MQKVLVRGANQVGSAVAHRLFSAGFAVMIHDDPAPTDYRRTMSFIDAIFEGNAELEHVQARRIERLDALGDALQEHLFIAVVVAVPFAKVLTAVRPDVLVHALMQKRAVPEPQVGLAPLTVGLGPHFVAGIHADVLVETSWENLGAVIREGATLPLRGEPQPLGGAGRERFRYAPAAGLFRTSAAIGDPVVVGDVVATIDGVALTAPIDGVLRALSPDGVRVVSGTKVVEVDPRGELDRGLGARPRVIAEGVLEAIQGANSR